MSGNRRKNTPQPPVNDAETPVSARVVAIPKDIPPPANNAAPKPKSERIGDILRQARLDKNDDLYLIAEYLCIKPAFLIALENSRYDEFPADAYVIGFLRTYANFLGVDGKDAVDRYRYEMAGRRKKPILSMPTPVSEGRAPSGIIMVAATIGVLLIYALWYGISSANRAEIHAQPPLPTVAQPVAPAASTTTPDSNNAAAGLTAPVGSPSVAPVAAAPAIPATAASAIPPESPGIMLTGEQPAAKEDKPVKDEAAAAAAPVPAPGKTKADKTADKNDADAKAKIYGDVAGSRVTIRALQSSWVMVTDDSGKAIFDRVLKPGDTYKVPNKPGLSLTTGNGSGIILSLDGADLPKVANGAPHVVRNVTLDPDRLTATPATDQ